MISIVHSLMTQSDPLDVIARVKRTLSLWFLEIQEIHNEFLENASVAIRDILPLLSDINYFLL